MTDKQINRAIAEACGWTDCGVVFAEENEIAYGLPPCRAQETDPDYYDETPDYCNDLNAMHEAEKILSSVQHIEYTNQIGFYPDMDYVDSFDVIHATARQRAEAFLRVLNLYEDHSK